MNPYINMLQAHLSVSNDVIAEKREQYKNHCKTPRIDHQHGVALILEIERELAKVEALGYALERAKEIDEFLRQIGLT